MPRIEASIFFGSTLRQAQDEDREGADALFTPSQSGLKEIREAPSLPPATIHALRHPCGYAMKLIFNQFLHSFDHRNPYLKALDTFQLW